MIDLVLFAGRILLVVILYVFLYSTMRTGIGLVRGQRRDAAIWSVDIEKGAKGIRGLHVDILGPVVVGRSPSSDIVIDEPYVSATHARFTLQGPALVLEDLGSTARWSTATPSPSPSPCATATMSRWATPSCAPPGDKAHHA